MMKEDTQEKNLIERNEENIFGKIKRFFKNIFGKKETIAEEKTNEVLESEKEKSGQFKEYIKIVDDDETELLELQRRFKRGEIADNDLTQEQIDSLYELYERQIEDIQRSINAIERQIAKYKK